MERRDAVKYISVLLGGTLIGAEAFLTGCKSATGRDAEWSDEDVAYLNEIAETILPKTTTPGAKDANVGQFMTVMVNDCYEDEDQKIFREGMAQINNASKDKFGKQFMAISSAERHELLVTYDAAAQKHLQELKAFNKNETAKAKEEAAKGNANYTKKKMKTDAFVMMKQLTLLGFFTSEVAVTKVLNYQPVPGKYDGCVPYKKGDKLIA